MSLLFYFSLFSSERFPCLGDLHFFLLAQKETKQRKKAPRWSLNPNAYGALKGPEEDCSLAVARIINHVIARSEVSKQSQNVLSNDSDSLYSVRSRRRAVSTLPFGVPGAFPLMGVKIAWMQLLGVRSLDGDLRRLTLMEKASARIERLLGRVSLVTFFARAKKVTPAPAGTMLRSMVFSDALHANTLKI